MHKLNQHKIERRAKTWDAYQTEDTIYSSDSECEYQLITRIELKRITRLKPAIKEEYTELDVPPILGSPIKADSGDDESVREALADGLHIAENKGSLRSHLFFAHRNGSDDVPLKARVTNKSHSSQSVGKTSRKVGRPLAINQAYRSFECKHCSKVFANRSNYNKHVLTLRNGKPFFCRACITGFDYRGDLIQHKRQHRECKSPPREKKFLCAHCGKYFERKDSLRQHTRVHTKERPYECGSCGRTFVNKGTLKDHMNSHLGLKPYVCPVLECGKAFRLACTLKQHKMNCHEPPTFQCSFCAKMFSDKKHME